MIADDLRNWLENTLAGKGYRVQFGAWKDGGNPLSKYAVIRPIGGTPQSQIRTPKFSIMFIGAANESPLAVNSIADITISAMITNWNQGDIASMTSTEPLFYQTEDGRPVFELSLDLIVSI